MYKKLRKNPLPALTTGLKSFPQSLLKNDIITKSLFNYLYIAPPRFPKFKLAFKIHKPGVPPRPITDSYLGFNCYTGKFMSEMLLKYSNNIKSQVNSSFDLKSKLSKLPKECCQHHLVSIDVVNLYNNVPVEEAIAIAYDHYKNDPNPLINLTELEFKTWCRRASKSVFYSQKKWYEQTTGLGMGSSIAPILSTLFMDSLEKNSGIYSHPNVKFYSRYVDDGLIVWSGTREEFTNFVTDLNAIHPSIKFTYEWEDSTGSLSHL